MWTERPKEGSGVWLKALLDNNSTITLGGFIDEDAAHMFVRDKIDPEATPAEGKKHISLSFNLFDVDDMHEYKSMMNHRDYYCCLWDIMQELRKIRKYEEGLSDGEHKMIDRVYEFAWQTIGEYPFGEEF